MDVIYPEFPLINNIEFMCLYILEHGPVHLNELIPAVHAWRGDETQHNFHDLFGGPGTYYYRVSPTIRRYYHNFNVTVLPKRKGRVIGLSGMGFATAAKALARARGMSSLIAEVRTFYVLFTKSLGTVERVKIQGQDEYHNVMLTPPEYIVRTVEAKTMLGAYHLAGQIKLDDVVYYHFTVSKHPFNLRSKCFQQCYCPCPMCRAKKKEK
jgi:hypothetical protein